MSDEILCRSFRADNEQEIKEVKLATETRGQATRFWQYPGIVKRYCFSRPFLTRNAGHPIESKVDLTGRRKEKY